MKIVELSVISADLKDKFVSAGVDTLTDLVDLHTSPRRCLELSQETGLHVGQIREIIAAALFCQISGVDIEHSTLLVKIGIDSVAKLATSDAAKILEDMTQFRRLQGQPLCLPSTQMLQQWVRSAQSLVAAEESSEV